MKDSKFQARGDMSVLFILVTGAANDSGRSMVHVPFRFHVGETELGSGPYQVRFEGNKLRVSQEDREFVVVGNRTDSLNGTLVFVQCGQRYFLSKGIWPESEPSSQRFNLDCVAMGRQ